LDGSLRTLGIDDGYFPVYFKEGKLKTLIVGVVCSGLTPVNLAIDLITVDGLDGTEAALRVYRRLVPVDIVVLDGVTYAGFNVIDPEVMVNEAGVPVIVIFKHDLDINRVYRALVKHFSDWEYRFKVIKEVYEKSREYPTPWRPIRIALYKISSIEALKIVTDLQNTSPIPEPLRLADVIASGLTKGTKLLNLINRGRLGIGA